MVISQKILTRRNPVDLDEIVMVYLKDGWEFHGLKMNSKTLPNRSIKWLLT